MARGPIRLYDILTNSNASTIRNLRILKARDSCSNAVVETAEFLKRAKPLLSDSERAEMVVFIGTNPDAGEIIPETGGIRKLRWALKGTGKRGGARVIYYYRNESMPLFLLSVYAKNRKATVSAAERNAMRRLIPALIDGYLRRS